MTTTQSLVRQCLLATMERGRWYSIEELDELAQQTIIPDHIYDSLKKQFKLHFNSS